MQVIDLRALDDSNKAAGMVWDWNADSTKSLVD